MSARSSSTLLLLITSLLLLLFFKPPAASHQQQVIGPPPPPPPPSSNQVIVQQSQQQPLQPPPPPLHPQQLSQAQPPPQQLQQNLIVVPGSTDHHPNGQSLAPTILLPPPPPPPGSDETCGLNMKELRHDTRIVGGRSASYAEVPWIAHLRESHLFRVLGYNKCGGVLINHRWALTAGHCKPAFFSSLEIILGKHKTFEDAPPPEGSAMAAIVKVTGKFSGFTKGSSSENEIEEDIWHLGKHHEGRRKPGVMQVLADTIIVHPDYDSKTLENDLALIKFKRPVPYSEEIQPICLPGVNEDFTGLDGYATGWGLTDFDKRQLPETLQIVRLPIISNKRCQSMYKKAGHDKLITDNDLCAGYAKGGMDACEGDSGGPLIVRPPNDHRWKLAGIVSNGVKCGEPLLPGVYTRVSKFVPWIMEQMSVHS